MSELECRTVEDVYINSTEPGVEPNASMTAHVSKMTLCLEPVAWQHYDAIGQQEAEVILANISRFLAEALKNVKPLPPPPGGDHG